MSTQNALTQLKEFRQQVYTLFPERADALMDLLDALPFGGNTRARSVIALSLNSPFRRGYSSVPDSIDNFFRVTDLEQASIERRVQDKALLRLIARQLTARLNSPKRRPSSASSGCSGSTPHRSLDRLPTPWATAPTCISRTE